MKTLETIAGKTYVVTSPNGCTVTDETGLTLGTVDAGQQKVFVATGAKLQADDDSARITATFNSAPALGNGGGGVTIQFDTKPTSGSTNAVTSGGLFDLLKSTGIGLGRGTGAPGFYGISIGSESSVSGWGAICLGKDAKVDGAGSISIGSQVYVANSMGLGRSVTVRDSGVVAMAPPGKTNPQTILYLIGASTSLADTYENGEACLGYVVKDESGNILACGTRKLSELLTNNTAFAPAALDLDAPAPTPFLPTGIMEPIELPEDLTV